jgi:adenylate cyclase
MAREIERKFLVGSDAWRRTIIRSRRLVQGYLASIPACSIRVRLDEDGASLNIKTATLGVSRHEYDYPIPRADAEEILRHLCIKPLIEKTRHYVRAGNHTWEIDEFDGANRGLIVAEIELSSPDESFERPAWLGQEVSDDPRYYNVRLVENPYSSWPKQGQP